MNKDESKTNKELAVYNEPVAKFKSLNDIKAFAVEIVNNNLHPLTDAKDVMTAILFGNDLGIPPMVAVNNIYPINGKGTLSVHIMNAMLQKAGVVTEVLRNYEPCVYFALKEEGDSKKAALFDENGNVVSRDAEGNPPKDVKCTPIVLREGFIDDVPRENEVRGNKIINYRTILRFTRQIKQPNGSYKDMMVESSFSLREAKEAGLYPGKLNSAWSKYPKQMTMNRANTFGARMIASDIMMGMGETSEIADLNNLAYSMVDGGEHVKIHIPVNNNEEKARNTESLQDAEEVKEGASSKSDPEIDKKAPEDNQPINNI